MQYITEEEAKLIDEMKAQKICCASSMMTLGLRLRKEKNEQLIKAMRPLCGGFRKGLMCGALTGSACIYGLFDGYDKAVARELNSRLIAEMEKEFGSIQCEELVHNSEEEKNILCPKIMRLTFSETKKFLAGRGLISIDCEEK